jgi:hypothetical protein
MSVRIRVYPQYGGLGMAGGLGGYGMGGAVSASTYYNSKLQTQRQLSSLQLGYERALWGERLDKVRLEERLKNPYMGAYGGVGLAGGLPLGAGFGGLPLGGMPLGGVPLGGMPLGGLPMGGIPAGFGGGQTNHTSQVSTGGASQSVTNSNVNNVSSVVQPQVGWGGGWGGGGWGGSPFGGFGGGGLVSGLLGALI